MLKTLSSIAALLIAIAYLALGNGLFSTLLSVRSSLQLGSTETTGAIMSSYFLGLVIGVFWCRDVIRKVGHIRAFAAFALHPVCTAHANDFLDAEQRVNAAGGFMVVYGCAAAGPLVAATVMGFAGAGGLITALPRFRLCSSPLRFTGRRRVGRSCGSCGARWSSRPA